MLSIGSRVLKGRRHSLNSLPALIAYVRKPSGSVPPYVSKVVSNAELADIRAYLASIPEPSAVKSIPLLNQ
jgi:hypothetical protein